MGIYFSIASFMFVVFFIIIIGVPLVMYAKSRIDDAIDNTVDSWDENPYLVFIDNLYDSFDWYYTSERIWWTFGIVIVLSLVWFLGIIAIWYFINKMVKTVKDKEYEDIVNKNNRGF